MSLTQGTRRALLRGGQRAWSVQFYQENDGIDFGSGANIDDLPTGDCTIEFLARIPKSIGAVELIMSKSLADGTVGWRLQSTGAVLRCVINHAADNALVDISNSFDNIWHHFALDWDVGTLTARAFLDGKHQMTDTAAGAYLADAAQDCLVNARGAIGQNDGAFSIGPIRLSDSRRYTGASFSPPTQNTWPVNDANAQLITRMNDRAGATVTDYSGNGYDGTITFGASTRWFNGPV